MSIIDLFAIRKNICINIHTYTLTCMHRCKIKPDYYILINTIEKLSFHYKIQLTYVCYLGHLVTSNMSTTFEK